jgi:hypothetical protein
MAGMIGVTAFCGGIWIKFFFVLWNDGFGPRATLWAEAFLLLWMVAMPLLLASAARDFVIHKRLLAEGEVALGRINELRLVGKRRRHRIEYSFEDAVGRTFNGSGYDYSRELLVGCRTPVFYDSFNPGKRSVPLCGTSWNLILRGSLQKI